MGKVLHLHKREQKNKSASALFDGITAWLNNRPPNTRRQYMRIAQSWSESLGVGFDEPEAETRWSKATHAQVTRWIAQLKERPAQSGRAAKASGTGLVSMATVRHKVVIMKAVYDELIAQGFVSANIFHRSSLLLKKHVFGERRPHDKVPDNAVKKLLSWRPKDREGVRDLAIMHLLFGAALRRSEVISLRVIDVLTTDEGTTYIRLYKTKAQKAQTVALPDWVAHKVVRLLEQRRQEGAEEEAALVVVYRDNGRESPMSDSTIYRLFKAYCRRFHIDERFSPHCARVTAITRMLDQGCNHREVQELSRHGSVAMVEKYDRKRQEIDKSASKKLRY